VCTQRQKEKEIYLLSSTNISEDKKAALENETAEMKVTICCVIVNNLSCSENNRSTFAALTSQARAQGADPSPSLPLSVAMAGSKHLNE
jgi:hypothetical protein